MERVLELRQVMNQAAWLRRPWQLIAGRGSVGRYGLIGVSGVALDLLIYAVLIREGAIPVIATISSTLLGITNNYIWNSLLNFKLKLSGKRGAKFLTVGLTGLVASATTLQILLSIGFSPIVAKWLSLPLVVGGQFLANKLWSFKGVDADRVSQHRSAERREAQGKRISSRSRVIDTE